MPAFHKAYLEAMVNMFGRCTRETEAKLERAITGQVDHPSPPHERLGLISRAVESILTNEP